MLDIHSGQCSRFQVVNKARIGIRIDSYRLFGEKLGCCFSLRFFVRGRSRSIFVLIRESCDRERLLILVRLWTNERC